jgi:predicted DNA-binding transcriptional regulator YafY
VEAYCYKRRDHRTFRLDRVELVEDTIQDDADESNTKDIGDGTSFLDKLIGLVKRIMH